ncbi:MAG: TetR/AcrR family transcriptional regulator [Gordonibacter sp.]|nr:TetR/AcrR family transcriptional regulator [Gordonibacter sp.]
MDGTCKHQARREEIVFAARDLYEERGLEHTTIKDIAERVGVARSLIYHYFPDKDALTDAVLDDLVEDFLEALRYWNAQREHGNVDKALADCLRLFRNGIFENGSFRCSLANTENAALYLHFIQVVADRIARYIVNSTVKDFERYHEIEIDHVYETFYMLIIGLIGLVRAYPEISDSTLRDLAAQTLHIERYLRDEPEGGVATRPA